MNISELKKNAPEKKSADFHFKDEKGRTLHASIDIEKDKITIFGINETHSSASFSALYGKYDLVEKGEKPAQKEEVAEEPSTPNGQGDNGETELAEKEVMADAAAEPVAVEGNNESII